MLGDDDGGNFPTDPDDCNHPMQPLPGAAALEEGGAGGSVEAVRETLKTERRELEEKKKAIEDREKAVAAREAAVGAATSTAMTSASSSVATNNR